MTNNELIEILDADFRQAINYRERRQAEWNDNYVLYRGRADINRLTQRQNVIIPLLKETLRTWLANIDDAPSVEFEIKTDTRHWDMEAVNDSINFGKIEEKEIALKEYWTEFMRHQKVELKDIVDKKQVGLYGRSFKKLNVVDGRPTMEIIDPQDILIDRYTDTADIDTAQFLFHTHIYRTLQQLEENPNYDQEIVKDLKRFYATTQGIVKATNNLQSASLRAERLTQMGVPDVNSPRLGETYVELVECYRKLYNPVTKNTDIHLIVRVDNHILCNKPLESIIGMTEDNFWSNHYPFSTWADDIEKTDFWSDGLADIARPVCKVLNSWFSQLVENRTLRNFGMNYYDATNPQFTPQTFEPVPWGWYPVPGDPNRVVRRIDIPELSESLDEMMYLTGIVEKATAITAIQKGVRPGAQVTLGEVQLLAGKAQERAIATAKFYGDSWKDFAHRWYKMIEAQANNLEAITLFKKSWSGKTYSKMIAPKSLLTLGGYKVTVLFSSEQESNSYESLQKFNAVLSQMPNNMPLHKAFQKKMLDMLDLSPDQIREILGFEDQQRQMMLDAQAQQAMMQQAPVEEPIQEPIQEPVAEPMPEPIAEAPIEEPPRPKTPRRRLRRLPEAVGEALATEA